MDTFEEMLRKMQQMTDAEQKAALDSLRKKCNCIKCPTCNDCMKGKQELLYCVTGKTGCAAERKGCICVTCPVTSLMGLKNAYFCVKGSEREIRKI
jgi:hypothetical protein